MKSPTKTEFEPLDCRDEYNFERIQSHNDEISNTNFLIKNQEKSPLKSLELVRENDQSVIKISYFSLLNIMYYHINSYFHSMIRRIQAFS